MKETTVNVWESINQVPKGFRRLQGAQLNLDQCNLIYKTLAIKHARLRFGERLDPNYAAARTEFTGTHKLLTKGNTKIWIQKNTEGGDI